MSLAALYAQGRPTGTGYVTAAFSGTTLYAYAQTQLSGMQIPPGTKIVHTVTAGFSLGVKGGSLKAFSQSASAGPQYSQEVEDSGDIPDDGDVIYIVVAGDIASCNYFGPIWSDSATSTYVLPPAITNLQISTGSSFAPNVDTPQSAGQTLVINGANLTAAGESNPPQICVNGACASGGAISVSGFHLGGSWNVSDTVITIPYWVDATATTGNYSLQLITTGGAATATFTVADGTPVITSVSPNSLVAGVQNTVTINGQYFGTNTPQVSTSLGGSVTVLSNLDNQIVVNITPVNSGVGTVQVTAEGYGGNGFLGTAGQPQSSQSQISAVPVAMQMQITGTAISTDGKYSEDTTIQVTAVRSDNGVAVPNFSGPVNIVEDGTSIYSQNGGSLPPAAIVLLQGSTSFVAHSLAGPKTTPAGNVAPDPALLKTTGYSMYGADLKVPQWFSLGQIDPRAQGTVPAWFQSRTRDIFKNATGNLATVLGKINSYSISGTINAGGQTPVSHNAVSNIVLNPYTFQMRTDGGAGQTLCGYSVSKYLTSALVHEARHAYQFYTAGLAGNDKDNDYLVNTIAIAPTTIFLDTTQSRTTCNDSAGFPGILVVQAYHGDSVFDAWANVVMALEEDSAAFAQN